MDDGDMEETYAFLFGDPDDRDREELLPFVKDVVIEEQEKNPFGPATEDATASLHNDAGAMDEPPVVPMASSVRLDMATILKHHVPHLSDALMRVCALFGAVVCTGVFIRLLNSVAMLKNVPIDEAARAMKAYVDKYHPAGCAASKLQLVHGIQLWQREATAVAAQDLPDHAAGEAVETQTPAAAAETAAEMAAETDPEAADTTTSSAPQPAALFEFHFVDNDEALGTLVRFAELTGNKWAQALATILEATMGLAQALQVVLAFVDNTSNSDWLSGSMFMIFEFVMPRCGLTNWKPSYADAVFNIEAARLCLSVLQDWFKPLEVCQPLGEFFVSRHALLECGVMIHLLEGRLQQSNNSSRRAARKRAAKRAPDAKAAPAPAAPVAPAAPAAPNGAAAAKSAPVHAGAPAAKSAPAKRKSATAAKQASAPVQKQMRVVV